MADLGHEIDDSAAATAVDPQPDDACDTYKSSKGLLRDARGAVAIEWALLLGGIAIPAYWIMRLALAVLAGHYRMMTTLNGLPFP